MRNRAYYKKHRYRLTHGKAEVEIGDILIEELRETQWSEAFEKLMRNKLVMGALRYGKLHDTNKPKFDRIGSIRIRIEAYILSGNKEYLVDIANLCLLEFEEGNHPYSHFESIDDGEHVKAINHEEEDK